MPRLLLLATERTQGCEHQFFFRTTEELLQTYLLRMITGLVHGTLSLVFERSRFIPACKPGTEVLHDVLLPIGNGHSSLSGSIDLSSPKLWISIGLINALLEWLIATRSVVVVVIGVSQLNIIIRLGEGALRHGELRPRVGHGKVSHFDIANDTAIRRRNAGNEHGNHPHHVQELGTTPSGLNRQRHVVCAIVVGITIVVVDIGVVVPVVVIVVCIVVVAIVVIIIVVFVVVGRIVE